LDKSFNKKGTKCKHDIKNTEEWAENHDLSHRLPSFSSIYQQKSPRHYKRVGDCGKVGSTNQCHKLAPQSIILTNCVSVTSQQTQNQIKCIMKILHMELVRMFIIESFRGLDVSTHCFQHKASRRMKPRIWTRCYAVDRKCIHCISHMYDVLLFNMFVKPHLAVLMSMKGEITTK